MTTDHQSLPLWRISCAGTERWCSDKSVAVHWDLGFARVVQAKLSPQLCFAWGHPASGIKQSEMAATCAGLGDSQAKTNYESKLVAARARPGSN